MKIVERQCVGGRGARNAGSTDLQWSPMASNVDTEFDVAIAAYLIPDLAEQDFEELTDVIERSSWSRLTFATYGDDH